MTDTYLIAGTASHVGKSTVAAGLCRLLSDRGVDVAPFKAQNMSNNARAVPRASGEVQRRGDTDAAFGEIGVSQYVQARAARIRPTTDCNPVLLKPRGDAESQLVIDGEAIKHYSAGEFYETGWERAREAAEAAHSRLASEHDVILAEGAGAIAEPNLLERDLANVETARFADATILLVADLERGGAFASVVGTAALLPDDLRERLGGVLLTKFRGDASLLDPAIETIEDRLDVPVLGVVPYDDPGLPAEDSVDLPVADDRGRRGDGDGVEDDQSATVAVARLPRISNFTDLEPLAATPGLRVSYRSLEDGYADADAVVLPGTKNAVDDLLAAREAGLDDELAAFDGPIVGLCGGYQLLGRRITNASVESTDAAVQSAGDGGFDAAGDAGEVDAAGDAGEVDATGGDGSPTGRDVVAGFDLLPVETRFEREKVVRASTLRIDGTGPLAGATGTVSGYEIHMGRTSALEPCETPFARVEQRREQSARRDRPTSDREGRPDASLGAARGDVVGTYLHGLFENEVARRAFAAVVFDAADVDAPPADLDQASPYDRAARLLAEHVDLEPVFDPNTFPRNYSH